MARVGSGVLERPRPYSPGLSWAFAIWRTGDQVPLVVAGPGLGLRLLSRSRRRCSCVTCCRSLFLPSTTPSSSLGAAS